MKKNANIPTCEMHELLVAYLYSEATADETRRFETHLRDCAQCKEELNAFEHVRDALQQWQFDDLPVLRLEGTPHPAPRSFIAALRDLFTVTPLWAKAMAGVATAMLLLAILGTEIHIGSSGFALRTDLFGRAKEPAQTALNAEQFRSELQAMVNDLIARSEQQQLEALKVQLVTFESQIQNLHADELARLATAIQEHRTKIKTIERDLDRRAGLDLSDILFGATSEDTSRRGEREGGD